MSHRKFAIGALLMVSVACAEEPVQVVFNQRLSSVQMEPQGAGCTSYLLGGASQSRQSGNALDFIVSQWNTDEAVVVEVQREPIVVSSKSYGESFFRDGTVDEYIASSPSGIILRLRHWGAVGGLDSCTPLDQDGP